MRRRRSTVGALLAIAWILATPVTSHAQTPAPAPAPPPSDDNAALRASVEKLQKELSDLKADQEVAKATAGASQPAPAVDVDTYQDRLKLYGFTDMGFEYMWYPDKSGLQTIIPSRATTFVLGDVNLFVDARPTERWRALTEVRLTNYPNGVYQIGAPGVPYSQVSTTISDTNSASGGWTTVKYGSIVLERAQIEYTAADWLTVRTGYWFTPYGIWNVDHGAPTLIPLAEPYFVLLQAFPQQQLGVDLTGNVRASHWELEYHAYVSNGRTPGEVDLINDKMLGARAVARREWGGNSIAVGTSGYWGRYADIQPTITAFQPLMISSPTVVSYAEEGFGADVSLDLGKLRVRSEMVVHHRAYDPGKRAAGMYPGAYAPDFTLTGAYLLGAYRLPFWGLEPYVYFERDNGFIAVAEDVAGVSGGLNIHFTPYTELKLQYQYIRLYDSSSYYHRDTSDYYTHFVDSRLVVAF